MRKRVAKPAGETHVARYVGHAPALYVVWVGFGGGIAYVTVRSTSSGAITVPVGSSTRKARLRAPGVAPSLDRSARHDHIPVVVGVVDVQALLGASASHAIVNATLAGGAAPDVGAAWTESVSVSAFTFAWSAGLTQAATAGVADELGVTVGLADGFVVGVPATVGAADGPGPPVGLEDVAGSDGTDDWQADRNTARRTILRAAPRRPV